MTTLQDPTDRSCTSTTAQAACSKSPVAADADAAPAAPLPPRAAGHQSPAPSALPAVQVPPAGRPEPVRDDPSEEAIDRAPRPAPTTAPAADGTPAADVRGDRPLLPEPATGSTAAPLEGTPRAACATPPEGTPHAAGATPLEGTPHTMSAAPLEGAARVTNL